MSGDVSEILFFVSWPTSDLDLCAPQPLWTILFLLYFLVVDICTGIYLYYFYLQCCSVFLNVLV